MRWLALIMSCAVGLWSPVSAFALAPLPQVPLTQGALTPAQVVEIGLARDGVDVLVQGEALGEALVAPGGKRWVNILGDGTAVGVVLEAVDVEAIERFGEYRQRGSTLLVEGVVNSACDEHGGDLDVHATSVRIIDEGYSSPHAVHPLKLVFATLSAGLAMLLWWRYRRMRRLTYL